MAIQSKNNINEEKMEMAPNKMKNLSKVLFLVFFAFLTLSPAIAGMGLTPGRGTYNFTKQGGTIQFVISNPSSYDREFGVSIKDLPTTDGNRYVSKVIPSDKIVVKAGDFKVFNLQITPDETVEYGRRYAISLFVSDTGRLTEKGEQQGIGVSGLESISAGFYIYFENKGTTVSYGGFEEESTRRLQERLNQKPNYLPLILAIVLAAVLLGLLVFFIAKRRKEGEGGSGEDEIVVGSSQPKG